MTIRKVLLAGVLAIGAAGVAVAAAEPSRGDDGARHEGHHMRHDMMRASVEVQAMHNLMAELLSAKTGKSASEIKALFEKAGNPHAVTEQLGLSHDDMRALHEKAHGQLIDKAAAAGLITAEQAAKLHAAPLPAPPRERHSKGGDDDRH
jgi:hypothetical protein